MAADWAADVRKYAPAADEGIIAGVVRYCGIALTKRDSSLVSFSDPKELDRVRNGFMKKKLALTDSDDVLNAALAKVGERMKADRTKNRVTVYYLLAEEFGKLDLFQKKAAAAKAPAKATAKPAAKAAAAAAPADTPAKKATAKPASKVAPAKAVPAKAAPAQKAKTPTAAKVAAGAAAAGVASLATVGDKTRKAASAAVDLGSDAVSAASGAAGKAAKRAGGAVSDAADAVATGAKDAAGAAGAAVTGAAVAAAAGVAGIAASAGDAAHKLTSGDDGKPSGSRWLWYLFAAALILAFLWWLFCSQAKTADAGSAVVAASSEAIDTASGAVDLAAAPTEGAVAIPEGDGVTVENRNGKPVVKVYFPSGKTIVPNAIDGARAGLKSYLETHAGSTLGVSGFNDSTGNAAVNAALSKKRAEAVRDVLVSAGIPAASVSLVKPVETTDKAAAASAARRVEIVVQ